MPATLSGVSATASTGRDREAVRRLADAEHLPAVAEHGALDHGADHGVQAGAVATAGQQAETHGDLLALRRRAAPYPGRLCLVNDRFATIIASC